MKRLAFRLATLAAMLPLLTGLSSCVHEWPHLSESVEIDLLIQHELPWTEFYYHIDMTRSDPWLPSYRLSVYPEGVVTGEPQFTFEFTRDDMSLADFHTSISLPPGDWDIYGWQDYTRGGVSPFYDATDIAAISYKDPYHGDTDMRDAFESKLTVHVPETSNADTRVQGEMMFARPLAKYVFIATDLAKFYDETLTRYKSQGSGTRSWNEMSRAEQEEAIRGFSMMVYYPLYMPSVYNMFTQKVLDSTQGISYEAPIRPIDGDRAIIALDYVWMNHHASGVQVMLALKTEDGDLIPVTNTITVPLLRNQITFVDGEFLTTSMGGGLNIDFSFGGDFNIEL